MGQRCVPVAPVPLPEVGEIEAAQGVRMTRSRVQCDCEGYLWCGDKGSTDCVCEHSLEQHGGDGECAGDVEVEEE